MSNARTVTGIEVWTRVQGETGTSHTTIEAPGLMAAIASAQANAAAPGTIAVDIIERYSDGGGGVLAMRVDTDEGAIASGPLASIVWPKRKAGPVPAGSVRSTGR